jgi:hypothetical protein
VDAFLASAKQTAEPLPQGQKTELNDRNCDVEGNCRTGPDLVVSLLADEIIGAAFDHARDLRYALKSGIYGCAGVEQAACKRFMLIVAAVPQKSA